MTVAVSSGLSQTAHTARNQLYVEGGGAAGYGSLNYERTVFQTSRLAGMARAGLGTYHLRDYTRAFNPDVILPMAFQVCYGNSHRLEVGFGAVVSSTVTHDTTFQPNRRLDAGCHGTFGYRYHRRSGGIIFRISYTPLLTGAQWRHWAGGSIGYAF